MDWNTIVIAVVSALGSGGILATILNLWTGKRSRKLDDDAKEFDIQEHKKDEIVQDWKDISAERKERAEELSIALRESEQRVRDKEKVITELRTKLDDLRTYCAVAELLKCEDLTCERRRPPFASSVVSTSKSLTDFVTEGLNQAKSTD